MDKFNIENSRNGETSLAEWQEHEQKASEFREKPKQFSNSSKMRRYKNLQLVSHSIKPIHQVIYE